MASGNEKIAKLPEQNAYDTDESIPLQELNKADDNLDSVSVEDDDKKSLLTAAPEEPEIVAVSAQPTDLCFTEPLLNDTDNGDMKDYLTEIKEPDLPHLRDLLQFCITEPVIREEEAQQTTQGVKAYKRRITAFRPENKVSLRTELHSLAQMNKYENLPTFCEYLKKQGINLWDEEMLGDKFKESALHIAIVVESNECVAILVEYGGPDLVLKPYTSPEYLGVTTLHLAIMKQSIRNIHMLMGVLDDAQKHTLLYAKGEGKGFQFKYDFVWIGLHVAAAQGDIDIFETLLGYGADLWVTDPDTGNTVLHTLARVAQASPDLCVKTLKSILASTEVRNWWKAKKLKIDELGIKSDKLNQVPRTLNEALLKVENHDRLTPFTLAVFMGSVGYARAILEVKHLYAFPQWDLGPTSYSLFEVSEIDSALCNIIPSYTIPVIDNKSVDRAGTKKTCTRCDHDKPSKPSVLEVYAFGLNEQDLDFGGIPTVEWVMINKWETYKRWFFGWFVLHIVVMICLTICLEYRDVPSGHGPNNTEDHHHTYLELHSLENITAKDIIIHILEIFVLAMALIYLVVEIVDVIVLYRRGYWKGHSCEGVHQRQIPMLLTLQFDVHRLMLLVFSVFVIAVFVLRLVDSVWQDFAYAVAVLCGWGFLMFFMQASENMGIFIVMLRRMIMKDLAHFAIIFFICLISFGSASYSLFQQAPNGHPEEVHTIPMTLYSFFRLLVGLEELSISNESRIPWMMKTLFILFVLCSNILLLNMLIAAMSSTYAQWESFKKPMWIKTRTKAVLMIERRLPKCLRPHHNLEKYGEANKWFLGGEQMMKWNPLAKSRIF